MNVDTLVTLPLIIPDFLQEKVKEISRLDRSDRSTTWDIGIGFQVKRQPEMDYQIYND